MAPGYGTWGRENRSTLIRIPAAFGEYQRAELRSPDTMTNPYMAFGLLIYAGLEGLEQGMVPPAQTEKNLYKLAQEELSGVERLPGTLPDAYACAAGSGFLKKYVPKELLRAYLERGRESR